MLGAGGMGRRCRCPRGTAIGVIVAVENWTEELKRLVK